MTTKTAKRVLQTARDRAWHKYWAICANAARVRDYEYAAADLEYEWNTKPKGKP